MSKYCFIVQIDVPAEREAEFNELHNEEHIRT